MDEEGMSGGRLGARCVGLFVALSVAVWAAFNATMALYIVFVPTWPLWACCLVGGGTTLALMLLILMGAAHIFYEGIVVWLIVGSLFGYLASTSVSLEAERLERNHNKPLPQTKGNSRQAQEDHDLYRMMQAMAARQGHKPQHKPPQN